MVRWLKVECAMVRTVGWSLGNKEQRGEFQQLKAPHIQLLM